MGAEGEGGDRERLGIFCFFLTMAAGGILRVQQSLERLAHGERLAFGKVVFGGWSTIFG